MKTLACSEGSHEEVNNGTTVPLKKGLFRAFSCHPFHRWFLTSGNLHKYQLPFILGIIFGETTDIKIIDFYF